MSESLLRMKCPNLKCQTILAVPESARGKIVRCRSCGATITVPQKNAPTEAETAAPEK